MTVEQDISKQPDPHFREALEGMGLVARPGSAEQLFGHIALLRQWNQAYNLVAPADLASLPVRHVLDSLSALPFVAGRTLLDVGTGAGFPGVPLAIMKPELECTLLDSSGKKIRFLRHVKRSLKLPNIHPVQSRVEALEASGAFDTITSRAFASLLAFATAVRHLVNENTRLLAMKGKYPEPELEALPAWVRVDSVEKIHVPGLRAERHLVIMSASQ